MAKVTDEISERALKVLVSLLDSPDAKIRMHVAKSILEESDRDLRARKLAAECRVLEGRIGDPNANIDVDPASEATLKKMRARYGSDVKVYDHDRNERGN